MSAETSDQHDSVVALLQVVPVRLTAPASEGGEVIVPSVELWDDCVRWQITQAPRPAYFSYMRDRDVKQDGPDGSEPRPPDKYSMRDDVGTTYKITAGTGGGYRRRA